ncbi:threonine synthase [Tahibacter amnicola]|uniref:Threonine synthase n=1 Tax=Tahibacter amnicola TaxID=2976241 RepID=A0ABY6BIX2_9GAMM|nr:threonine synthase [Tahibacter amnicola]UXI69795.1 threonine synthase [Tahibacter amnicola]
MKFVSTRGSTAPTGLGAAIAAGLAPDGGLYVPAVLPQLSTADFAGADTLPAIATRLLTPFFAGDPLASDLDAICTRAFDFPAPLKPLSTPQDHVLELFHGPTAAFKDFGARFLAECLSRLQKNGQRPLTIVVATSGDTGAAVAAAFHRQPGLRVVVLYPDGRVSPRQAHQLGCFGDNITTFKVQGSFDDCQALVKQALNDADLQAITPLSSANSISLGRLLPQMSYYADASLRHWRTQGEPLNLVVPTGNLGNAFAGVLARAVGLPIGRIVLATNANDVLPAYFHGAPYTPRASVPTLANAMDVGAPSNFERLRWLYPDDNTLRGSFQAHAVEDATIRDTIRQRNDAHGEVFCPHTATAIAILAGLRREGVPGHWAVAATAHPAKFESIVEPLVGRPVAVPAALAELLARPAHATPMAAHYPAFRERLAQLP